MATEYRYLISLPSLDDPSLFKERRIKTQVTGEGSPRVTTVSARANRGHTDWIATGSEITVTSVTVDHDDVESADEQTLGPTTADGLSLEGEATCTKVTTEPINACIMDSETREV